MNNYKKIYEGKVNMDNMRNIFLLEESNEQIKINLFDNLKNNKEQFKNLCEDIRVFAENELIMFLDKYLLKEKIEKDLKNKSEQIVKKTKI